MDISGEIQSIRKNSLPPSTIFRHESFQLWESLVRSVILEKSHDLVILQKTGLSLIPLGTQDKRILKDEDGNEKAVHSLQSMNYLKVDTSNYILFECAEGDILISV